MKRTMAILVPCLLTAIFLAAGIGLLIQCIRTVGDYRAGTADAQAALENADPAQAEDAEQAVEDLRAENEALENGISVLETENTAAAEALAALQSEYDEMCLEDETAYYLAVLDALTEGMMQVENALEDAQ